MFVFVDESIEIALTAQFGDNIAVRLVFVYVVALDDIGMIKGFKYFEFFFLHFGIGTTLFPEVDDFDCHFFLSLNMISFVDYTAVASSNFATDTEFVIPNFLFLDFYQIEISCFSKALLSCYYIVLVLS